MPRLYWSERQMILLQVKDDKSPDSSPLFQTAMDSFKQHRVEDYYGIGEELGRWVSKNLLKYPKLIVK